MKAVAAHLLETIERSLPLLQAISDADASVKPSPNKWSYKEIIGHLIDSAGNNQQKFVRTIQQDGLKFPLYQQDEWVAIQRYNERRWEELLPLFEFFNRHIAHIIYNIPDEALPNQLYIGEKGPYALDFIARDYPEHLKHHLKQVLPDAAFLQIRSGWFIDYPSLPWYKCTGCAYLLLSFLLLPILREKD